MHDAMAPDGQRGLTSKIIKPPGRTEVSRSSEKSNNVTATGLSHAYAGMRSSTSELITLEVE
jgi:hypothetical protein